MVKAQETTWFHRNNRNNNNNKKKQGGWGEKSKPKGLGNALSQMWKMNGHLGKIEWKSWRGRVRESRCRATKEEGGSGSSSVMEGSWPWTRELEFRSRICPFLLTWLWMVLPQPELHWTHFLVNRNHARIIAGECQGSLFLNTGTSILVRVSHRLCTPMNMSSKHCLLNSALLIVSTTLDVA